MILEKTILLSEARESIARSFLVSYQDTPCLPLWEVMHLLITAFVIPLKPTYTVGIGSIRIHDCAGAYNSCIAFV